MNAPRRRPQQQNQNQGATANPNQKRRPNRQQKPKAVELWRPVPQLGPIEPIAPATDPTALLRSLGSPPLQGQGAVAEHYLAAVIERAAGLATALAASADLLAPPPNE